MRQIIWLPLTVALLAGGVRAGAQAENGVAGPLVDQLRSETPDRRHAAVNGLVRLGAGAVPVLVGRLAAVPGADDVPVQTALTAVVQAAARSRTPLDRAAMASALLKEAEGERPLFARQFVLEVLSQIAGPESVPGLARLLRNGELADAARQTLARVPGDEATRALVNAVPDAPAELKIGLIAALGDRRAAAAQVVLLNALKSEDFQVRIAARAALARLADPDLEKPLRPDAEDLTERERRRAIDSYLRLGDTLRAVAGKGPDTAARIYRWALEKGPDTRTRQAGAVGLGRLGTKSVEELVHALSHTDPAVRASALRALAEMPAATEPLLKLFAKAKPDQQRPLLLALSRRKDSAALPILIKAANEGDAATITLAMEGLSSLRDPEASSELFRLAEKGPESLRPAALKEFLTLAGSDRDPAVRRTGYERGLKAATTDENRRLALQGLGSLAQPATLPLIEPYLAEGPLRADAAAAAAAIADRLAASGQMEKARALHQRALEATTDAGLRTRIATRLRTLGVTTDLAGQQGYISQWMALGPLPGREKWTRQDALNPAAALDMKRAVAIEGRELQWKAVRVDDPGGMLDLETTVARQGDAVAYLYAELESAEAQDVVFKVGSDDGFVLWVNGLKAGEVLADRPYVADQDSVKGRLAPGVNRILLKVTQGGGQWAAGVRVTTPAGAPAKILQKKLN